MRGELRRRGLGQLRDPLPAGPGPARALRALRRGARDALRRADEPGGAARSGGAGAPVAPTLTLAELDGLAHFRERESFVEVEHAEPGLRVRYPGPFARFGASPLRYTRPPPRLDEHGAEIRAERPAARPRPAPAASRLPLAGVKILDLFWVLAVGVDPHARGLRRDRGARRVDPSGRHDPHDPALARRRAVARRLRADAGRERRQAVRHPRPGESRGAAGDRVSSCAGPTW